MAASRLNRRRFLTFGAAFLGAPPALAGLGIDGFRGALDATNLGVERDSGADQRQVLQRAIDASARVGSPLFLPPGRYVTSALELTTGAHIVGVPGATRLIPVRGGPLIRSKGAAIASLSHLTFEGMNLPMASDAGLVETENVARFVMSDCTITGATANGIKLSETGGWIENSTVTRCGEAAIFSTDAEGLRLTGNLITDCANNGILVWTSVKREDGTIVSENRIERIGASNGGSGEWGNGVNIYRAANVLVTNNRIKDCAYTAVRSNAGSFCQVVGNNCTRLGEVAIYAEFGYEGAVIAHNIIERAATGISMTNFSTGGRLSVCNGNMVRGLFTRDHFDARGVGIAAEADTVISANVVEDAPTAGLVLGWGPHLRDVTATGNIVRKARIGIGVSVADGAGPALISDNVIANAEKGAILGMAWNDAVTGDLATAPDERFPQITVSRNRVS
ncbi:MAG: TIGR03808 family TAT-translocated repetitive protein [Pseudomonadota bacterium]